MSGRRVEGRASELRAELPSRGQSFLKVAGLDLDLDASDLENSREEGKHFRQT